MKPIKKGCRAMIVNRLPEDNGKVVIVGKFIGNPDVTRFNINHSNRWEIDIEVESFTSLLQERRGRIMHVNEHNLQRIDDDDVALGSWEELSEIWSPKELVV